MKLQIVGAGTVGGAFGEALTRMGHEVTLKDKDWGEINSDAEILFVCTPETKVLEALEEIVEINIREVPVVIRSTITPKLYDDVTSKYGEHVSVVPEFLRAREALWMSLNPLYVVIGECCAEHGELLEKLFKQFLCQVVHTTPKTAIFVKLTSNAYLSTAVSFWNEVSLIAEAEKVNSHEVGRIVSLDPLIPRRTATMHGKPFGGHCLPKDLDQLISCAKANNLNPVLFKAVREINEKMKEKQK